MWRYRWSLVQKRLSSNCSFLYIFFSLEFWNCYSIEAMWYNVVMNPCQAISKCLFSTPQSIPKVLKVLAWVLGLGGRDYGSEKNEGKKKKKKKYLVPHHSSHQSQNYAKGKMFCSEILSALKLPLSLLTLITYSDTFYFSKISHAIEASTVSLSHNFNTLLPLEGVRKRAV